MLMEKLQGPINPSLLEGDELEVGCLEDENGGLTGMSYSQFLTSIGSYGFEDPYTSEETGVGDNDTTTHYSLPSLEDKMPFLQMLQSVHHDHPQPPPPPLQPPLIHEPNFQLLLKLQHQKMMMMNMMLMKPNWDPQTELESCVTTTNNNDLVMELHSPVKSESTREQVEIHIPPPLSQNFCSTEDLSPKCEDLPLNQRAQGRSKRPHCPKSSPLVGGSAPNKERRKRKRSSTRPTKNKEEVESQRMTHIAVERNRRRQMNEHLTALRSLMPPSYIQRGDQASIIGGAIDFVKELEQLLQSLQAQKRMKQSEENGDVSASSSTSSSSNLLNNLFMASTSSSSSSLHFRNSHNSHSHSHEEGNGNPISSESILGGNKGMNEEFIAENRSALADIEVVVIQNHVNLKIQCHRRPGQLLKAIVALEDLRLTVLHLNITSLHSFVHYSFNLKIEEDCKLGTADEVASAVHQIFSLISIS